jgi:hypothetical protein
LDSYRDTLKVINIFNLIQLNGFLIFFKIFFIKFFYSFSYLRNFKKYNNIEYELEKNHFLEEEISIKEIVKKIDLRGYSDSFVLKKKFINEFKNLAINQNNHDLKKIENLESTNIFKKKEETNENYLRRLKLHGINRLTGYVDLNAKNSISDFLLSSFLLKLAKSYLGSGKISISCSYFISLPKKNLTEKEKISSAQYFHWDNDFQKFLKLYIYLSDVNNDTGPHIFIPFTHKKKIFKHQLHRTFSDIDIYDSYSKVKKFLGKEGSLFFVDSYGLHKGETPKNNNRIMLNIHYGRNKILYSKFDKFIEF